MRRLDHHITFLLLWGLIASGVPASGEEPGSLTRPVWSEAVPGVEFARVDARRYCRNGSPRVAVIRLDPARCRIEPFHEREFAGAEPATIDLWQERLSAPVVFNAGLYGGDRQHLGILRRHGENLGGEEHRRWKGLLASGALSDSLPAATLLDLSVAEDQRLASGYANGIQSMMLFDRTGRIRVRRTEHAAPRAVVAVAGDGRLLVLVTEGSYTLWETALLLREAGWGLQAAMALDGGREANLAVEGGGVHYRSGESSPDGWLRSRVSLPGVIAVWSREAG